MTAEVRRRYADLSGVTLHDRTAGAGDPVVLLHGVPQSSHAWRHLMPGLSPAGSMPRAIAVAAMRR